MAAGELIIMDANHFTSEKSRAVTDAVRAQGRTLGAGTNG
jgi:hypothetical protein